MSDKTLVERLREVNPYENDFCIEAANIIGIKCGDSRTCKECQSKLYNSLTDAIEREYLPRPRFEDGEPVKIGDKFENHFGKSEYIAEIQWLPNMRYALKSESGHYAYKAGERVKRPEPEVLDANGVPIKVGDTVWHINTGECRTVDEVDDSWFGTSGYAVKLNPLMYSHKQSDSLERIHEDALMDAEQYVKKYNMVCCGEANKAMRLNLLNRQRKVLERVR